MSNNFVFADQCKLTLIDDTKVENCLGLLKDNKRVYLDSQGNELVGDKAVKYANSQRYLIPFDLAMHIRATKELKT